MFHRNCSYLVSILFLLFLIVSPCSIAKQIDTKKTVKDPFQNSNLMHYDGLAYSAKLECPVEISPGKGIDQFVLGSSIEEVKKTKIPVLINGENLGKDKAGHLFSYHTGISGRMSLYFCNGRLAQLEYTPAYPTEDCNMVNQKKINSDDSLRKITNQLGNCSSVSHPFPAVPEESTSCFEGTLELSTNGWERQKPELRIRVLDKKLLGPCQNKAQP